MDMDSKKSVHARLLLFCFLYVERSNRLRMVEWILMNLSNDNYSFLDYFVYHSFFNCIWGYSTEKKKLHYELMDWLSFFLVNFI